MSSSIFRVVPLVLALLLAQVVGVEGTAQAQTIPKETASTEERAVFEDAARTAWAFMERNYQPRTGLVKAHETYPFVTVWDIGSMALAYHSAHELGLIDQGELDDRLGALLGTLLRADMFEGTAFNKLYNAATGEAVDRKERPNAAGFGWSVLDLGRLLVALHTVGVHYPHFRDDAEAIVERMNLDQLIRDGYLVGRDLDPEGAARSYQEGRIGYEQYAAEGFAAWGHRAEKALSFTENTQPVDVYGVSVLSDRRGSDKLTSEPFIMMGLELGWDSPEWREISAAVLAAQKARYDATGQVTMVSEDAVPVEPYYFYYYSVYHDGQDFVVDAPGASTPLTGPRWVSTKAAFGWHALLGSDYTREALAAVMPAASAQKGWSSGVYEKSGRTTGSENVNTAAIVLEAAAYNRRGAPLAEPEG